MRTVTHASPKQLWHPEPGDLVNGRHTACSGCSHWLRTGGHTIGECRHSPRRGRIEVRGPLAWCAKWEGA